MNGIIFEYISMIFFERYVVLFRPTLPLSLHIFFYFSLTMSSAGFPLERLVEIIARYHVIPWLTRQRKASSLVNRSRYHLDLSGVEHYAIQTRSRLCSLLYDKRTDKVGQVLLEMEGREIPVRFFLSGEISEASIRFFQLYVEMQLRQMDCHGKCM